MGGIERKREKEIGVRQKENGNTVTGSFYLPGICNSTLLYLATALLFS